MYIFFEYFKKEKRQNKYFTTWSVEISDLNEQKTTCWVFFLWTAAVTSSRELENDHIKKQQRRMSKHLMNKIKIAFYSHMECVLLSMIECKKTTSETLFNTERQCCLRDSALLEFEIWIQSHNFISCKFLWIYAIRFGTGLDCLARKWIKNYLWFHWDFFQFINW